MVEADIRVALLARAGNARDHLHRVLIESGANLVVEGDPVELLLEQVINQSPNFVLVSLEPAIEEALDRFNDLLAMPGVDVMFDDAEVTRHLDGWDLNRWARHLVGKILRRDLLPPSASGGDAQTETQFSPDLALSDEKALPPVETIVEQLSVSDVSEDSRVQSVDDGVALDDFHFEVDLGDLPSQNTFRVENDFSDEALNVPVIQEIIEVDIDSENELDESISFEAIDLTETQLPVDEKTSAADFGFYVSNDIANNAEINDQLTVDATGLEQVNEYGSQSIGQQESTEQAEGSFLLDMDFLTDTPLSFSGDSEQSVSIIVEAIASSAPIVVVEEVVPTSVHFSSFGADSAAEDFSKVEDDVAALASHLDAFESMSEPSRHPVQDFGFDIERTKPQDSVAADAIPDTNVTASAFDFSNLSLQDMDTEALPAKTVKNAVTAKQPASLSTLSLESIDDAAAPASMDHVIDNGLAAGNGGAVLILAGLGGPDAVRQLVSTLPESLTLPVMISQHLEVGKHERLADQLAKISRMPVQLAKVGASAAMSMISVLPAGFTARRSGNSFAFVSGSLAELIAQIDTEKSVVVVLSGTDIGLVAALTTFLKAGGRIFAQDPELCFDPAAAQALQVQGVSVYPALGLARQISQSVLS